MSAIEGNAGRLADPAEERLRVMRWRFSLAAMLGANLLPLAGVIFWGWRLLDLIVVYWLETLVIGAFAILQMALTAGWFALFLVPFFIVHFGGFMAGHLVFLTLLFGDNRGMRFSEIPAYVCDLVVGSGLWLALVALCISHGVAFVVYFLIPWIVRLWRERQTVPAGAVSGSVMFKPYGRVIVMHATILLGAFLVELFGNRIVLLALLIALKMASDVYALRREPDAAAPPRFASRS